MVISKSEKSLLKRIFLFSLLSACFASLVSLGVTAISGLSGLFPLASIGKITWLQPVVFVVSFVVAMGIIMRCEGFPRN